MNLHLSRLVPQPLKERLHPHSSEIWMQDVMLRPGMRVFIQAPSGTGKTTLIHSLYGLRRDYEGTIRWNEEALHELTPSRLAALRATYVSIVFQDLRLFPELTVWENLELKRAITQSVDAAMAEDMLRRLGVLDKKEKPARTLSYGEQQRVAIVRALLQPFDWLLLDEPFSHLDHLNRERAVSLIQEMVTRNNAGMMLADLETNSYFPYHNTLFL